MEKKILIILIIALILFGFVLSFFYWFKFVKPETKTPVSGIDNQITGFCDKFPVIENEISCSKALKIVLEKYPGRISEVTQEQIISIRGGKSKEGGPVKEMLENVWFIKIDLESPTKISESNQKMIGNKMKVSVNRITGEVRIDEINWKIL